MPITLDGRIKFGSTITLPDQTGSLTVDIFGGPLARVQAAVFDANDKPIQAVGFDGFGPPLTTEIGGRASWLFQADPRASYVKWAVQAVRSGGNLGNYSVTAKIRQASGDALVTGQFSAAIAEGVIADDIIADGVNLAPASMLMTMQPGAST